MASNSKPAISSPVTQRKRPGDFTGVSTERLAAEKKVEQQEAAERMALLTAQAEVSNADIDFETGQPLPVVHTQQVEVNSPKRTIRVNTDIDQMTYGHEVWDEGDPENGRPQVLGPLRTFTFKEGTAYHNVPADVADHLNHLGYLSYIGA